MSVRSKLENIWYHYKSVILISLFLIFTLVFCFHSCVTKTEYDIQVYYVTGSSSMYTEQLNWIKEAVSLHCGDVNGDGEVQVAITGLRVGEYSDPTVRAQYLTPVQAGEIMLLFGDRGGIEFLYQNEYLQPITDLVSDPENDYAWKVNGSGLATQVEGFEMFSDVELYVSLRSVENTISNSFESGKANHQVACNTLQSMAAAASRYDIRVYWLSKQTQISVNQTQWIQKAVATRCGDFNGDGAVLVDVVALNLAKESTYKKYIEAIRTEDRYLLFGDETAIDTISGEDLLPSLEGVVTPLHTAGNAWLVNGSALSSEIEGFECFGESKIYAAVRVDSTQSQNVHEYAERVFYSFFVSEE